MMLIKAEIVRGAYEGIFRVTLHFQEGFGVRLQDFVGTLEECRQFIRETLKNA